MSPMAVQSYHSAMFLVVNDLIDYVIVAKLSFFAPPIQHLTQTRPKFRNKRKEKEKNSPVDVYGPCRVSTGSNIRMTVCGLDAQ